MKVSASTLVEERASLLFPRGTREVHWCSQIPALRDVESINDRADFPAGLSFGLGGPHMCTRLSAYPSAGPRGR